MSETRLTLWDLDNTLSTRTVTNGCMLLVYGLGDREAYFKWQDVCLGAGYEVKDYKAHSIRMGNWKKYSMLLSRKLAVFVDCTSMSTLLCHSRDLPDPLTKYKLPESLEGLRVSDLVLSLHSSGDWGILLKNRFGETDVKVYRDKE